MTPELKRACEVVFQEHKASDQPVNWHKDAFRGRISIGLSEMAKETLLKKKIIGFNNLAKKATTVLNPELASAVTFEEALIIIESKTPALATNTNDVKRVRVIDDFADYTDYSEEVEEPALRLIRVSDELDIAAHPAKWYMRPAFYYVVGPACAAALGALIAFLLSEYITRFLQ